MKGKKLSCLVLIFIGFTVSGEEISRALAEIAITTSSASITEEAKVATKKALIDVFGVSIAGYNSPGMSEIRQLLLDWGGKKQSTVWISGQKGIASNMSNNWLY